MIDWTSGKISFLHNPKHLNAGSVFSVSSDGTVDWQTRKRAEFEGSYSSKFFLRSEDLIDEDTATSLSFTGNPVKFLQGHNVFGTSNLTGLVYEAIKKCLFSLNLVLSDTENTALFNGSYALTRVDINYMYSMGSRADVMAWLYAAESSSRTRMGKGIFSGDTLYFQKRSTRWSLKFYSKGLELSAPGHHLPREIFGRSLVEYADDKLRAELTLRTKELKKYKLDLASNWGDNEPYSMFEEYMGRLEMSSQKISDSLMNELPNKLKGTYSLWKEGYDVRQQLARPTFYRHRKELLEYGVDISIKHTSRPNNVIPLLRIVEAIPVETPEWAEGTCLYFEPRMAV